LVNCEKLLPFPDCSILNPVSLLELSVHDKLIWAEETAVATRFVGAAGADAKVGEAVAVVVGVEVTAGVGVLVGVKVVVGVATGVLVGADVAVKVGVAVAVAVAMGV
jgi:hypothetical protein